jgi:DNA-binding XRE family transcriptional regulator
MRKTFSRRSMPMTGFGMDALVVAVRAPLVEAVRAGFRRGWDRAKRRPSPLAPPAPPPSFGARLRALREVEGLARRDIARLLGVSYQSVIDYEHDRGTPNEARLGLLLLRFPALLQGPIDTRAQVSSRAGVRLHRTLAAARERMQHP